MMKKDHVLKERIAEIRMRAPDFSNQIEIYFARSDIVRMPIVRII